jgi:decaprenyl-phosphate phosphoribosyltransferase
MSSFISLIRPKQWVKNVLVFAAPFAAGTLLAADSLLNGLLAFITFTAISSAVYIINDIRDVNWDRKHPLKMNRPIASGSISVTAAIVYAAMLALFSLVFSTVFLGRSFFNIIVLYLISQTLYIFFFKNVPVVELFLVASGFVLRAIGGGAAASVPISNWFLTVVAAAALFMVSGKRYGEIVNQGNSGETRKVLSNYTIGFLRMVLTVSLSASVVFYTLWAAELNASATSSLALISSVPFSIALLSYALKVEQGEAEIPEDLIFGDRMLVGVAMTWVLIFSLGTIG